MFLVVPAIVVLICGIIIMSGFTELTRKPGVSEFAWPMAEFIKEPLFPLRSKISFQTKIDILIRRIVGLVWMLLGFFGLLSFMFWRCL